ncbi:MAG: hypothetical protein M3Z08_13065 [Chloroflexota bacterium]|nr:hypothetical protein [Chloroflexota bacterium]
MVDTLLLDSSLSLSSASALLEDWRTSSMFFCTFALWRCAPLRADPDFLGMLGLSLPGSPGSMLRSIQALRP